MPFIEWRGNTCRVRWDTGRINPVSKRRIYDGKSGFTDEDTAFKYGLDRESDARNGRYISRRDGKMLMSELCPTWIEIQDLAYDSIRAYKTAITAQILPYWGDRAVGEITVPQYDAWAKHVRATWSANYAKNILMVFGLVMDYAVACELRKTSPVVKTRRRGKFVKRPKERKSNIDVKVIHDLALNANDVWGYPGYVYFLTVAFTGMRRAELFGLRREYCSPTWPASDPRPDPEEEARYKDDTARYGIGPDVMPALRVEFQHKYMYGRPTLCDPKYDSKRTLVLPPFLAEMFDMLLTSHSSEWAFPSVNDGPLLQANWSMSYYKPIVMGTTARGGKVPRADMPGVTAWQQLGKDGKVHPKRLHLARHGQKEWLDEDSVARVAVEARMGHELPGVEGVYSNVTVAMERYIMKVLQERWERFVASQGSGWRPPTPTPLPVDLGGCK